MVVSGGKKLGSKSEDCGFLYNGYYKIIGIKLYVHVAMI